MLDWDDLTEKGQAQLIAAAATMFKAPFRKMEMCFGIAQPSVINDNGILRLHEESLESLARLIGNNIKNQTTQK